MSERRSTIFGAAAIAFKAKVPDARSTETQTADLAEGISYEMEISEIAFKPIAFGRFEVEVIVGTAMEDQLSLLDTHGESRLRLAAYINTSELGEVGGLPWRDASRHVVDGDRI